MLLFEDKNKEDIRSYEFVTVTKEEYAGLLSAAEQWGMFKVFFYENIAKTKDGALAIEGYKVCDAMSVLDSQRYRRALNG